MMNPTNSIADIFDSNLGKDVVHVLVRLPVIEEARLIKECIASAVLKQHMIQELKDLDEKVSREAEREARIPEKRKRAWDELNDALLKDQGDKKKHRSFSSMQFEALPDRFRPQEAKAGTFFELMKEPPAIHDDVLDKLTETIEMKQRMYNMTTSGKDGNEATRTQFMSNVFEHVVNIYQQERSNERMKLAVQVKMTGQRVKASGVVDFVIGEGRKYICVVEAKHWDFALGDVQGVLGMEVAVEKNESEDGVMYGVVTNYSEWHFLKRTDDGIEMVKDAIHPRKPLREELQSVASRV